MNTIVHYHKKYLSLTLLFTLLSLTLCGPMSCGTDGRQKPSLKKEQEKFFENTWTLYLNSNLSKAKEHATQLAENADKFCGGTGSSENELKEEWKWSFVHLERQDFFDLISDYKVTTTPVTLRRALVSLPVDVNKVEGFLTQNPTVADVTEEKVTQESNLFLRGYPVVEYLLYGPTPLMPNSNRCKLLQVVTKVAESDVKNLSSAWDKKHTEVFKEAKAFKEVLEHYRRMIERLKISRVAVPSGRDSTTGALPSSYKTKEFETLAPYSKLGGWVLNEAVIKGLRGYYDGNYDGKSFESLRYLVEGQKKKEVNDRVKTRFAAVENALKPFVGISQGGDTLEEAIKVQATDAKKGEAIKTLIVSMTELYKVFDTDVPLVFGITKNASNGDGD